MIVYMTQGQKTVLSRIMVEGLPLHYLSVGRGYFARRRALHCLRQLYDSGVRRCICADVYLLSLAKQVDITSYPVLPLRLALLGSLLDILCPGGLQNAAAVLRCGPGGEETARAALTVLARRARYVQLDMEDPAALAAELPPTEAGKILPFLLSFGGLSVCCQVSACFGEEPLSWGKLLWGRLLHGLFTMLLAVPWLKRAVLPAMTGAAVPAFSVGRMLWGSGAMVLLCLLLTVRWERGMAAEG